MAQKHSARSASWRIKKSDALLPKRSRQLPQQPGLLLSPLPLLSPLLLLLLSPLLLLLSPLLLLLSPQKGRRREGAPKLRLPSLLLLQRLLT